MEYVTSAKCATSQPYKPIHFPSYKHPLPDHGTKHDQPGPDKPKSNPTTLPKQPHTYTPPPPPPNNPPTSQQTTQPANPIKPTQHPALLAHPPLAPPAKPTSRATFSVSQTQTQTQTQRKHDAAGQSSVVRSSRSGAWSRPRDGLGIGFSPRVLGRATQAIGSALLTRVAAYLAIPSTVPTSVVGPGICEPNSEVKLEKDDKSIRLPAFHLPGLDSAQALIGSELLEIQVSVEAAKNLGLATASSLPCKRWVVGQGSARSPLCTRAFWMIWCMLRGEPCGQTDRGGLAEIKSCEFLYITIGRRRPTIAAPASLA